MPSNAKTARPRGGVPPRFAGKTFVFAGLSEETDPPRSVLSVLIEAEGGRVVAEVDEKLDYLVVGRTKTGKPPAEQRQAERLNLAGRAQIRIVTQTAFHASFPLGREETVVLFRAGKEGVQRWAQLRGDSRTPLDLSGLDLRQAPLAELNLYGVNLDGADLRETDLTGTHLDGMTGVRLDGAKMAGCWGTGFTDCSLRNADLSAARLNCPYPIERCDFTGAKLEGASPNCATLTDVVFQNADLHRASLTDSKLKRADFTGANLVRACLYQCALQGANFTRACLRHAELTRADLRGANLTGADLTGATLFDADLRRAKIDGADFTGANVTGLKLGRVETTSAKGLDPARIRTGGRIGPAVQALENAAGQSRRLVTTATLKHKDGPVTLSLTFYSSRYIRALSSGRDTSYGSPASVFGEAMLDLARRHSDGKFQADLITAHGKNCPVKGKELWRLALAAWCEVQGVAVPSDEELRQLRKDRAARQQAIRAEMLAELRSGSEGVERWGRRQREERAKAGRFRRVDLKGASLSGASLGGLDFAGAIFERADLRKAWMSEGIFRRASFRDADLSAASLDNASLSGADFEGAALVGCNLRCIHSFRGVNFKSANLRRADFSYSDLRGADLSSAELEGARFEKTKHDATTRFPAGFVLPAKRGKGAPSAPRPAGLEVGSRVCVRFGMFAGLEGEVKEILEPAGAARVELTIFGRPVSVELEYEDVGQV